MYFQKIKIENVVPIEGLSIEFLFFEACIPKPLVIVQENGLEIQY